MAIRIGSNSIPPAGRLTMPRGTFLSNPSTAPDGALGQGSAMLPKAPTPPPFWDALAQLAMNPTRRTGETLAMLGVSPLFAPEAMAGATSAMVGLGGPKTGLYNPIVAFGTPAYRDYLMEMGVNVFRNQSYNNPNPIVGRSFTSSPTAIPLRMVQSLFGGLSYTEMAAEMRARGYERTYEAGVGEVWLKTRAGDPSQNPAYNQGTGFVNPTQLEPGERVTDERGVTYVGGTPTADGTAQYAITLPGGTNDKHGKFKWKTTVKKDEQGNWVRVYQKVLRKVYTRSHRKKQYARREEREHRGVSSGEISQLVNLRADYG